jgi:FtsH-binding integral membrane protein
MTLQTGSMAYMTATISSTYNIESVLMAAGITASCCVAITLFATCTKVINYFTNLIQARLLITILLPFQYDITSCAGVLFIVSWVFFMSTIIFGFFVRGDSKRTFQLIYSCIGALIFMLVSAPSPHPNPDTLTLTHFWFHRQYLAYETQLIFGGKKYEYSPEDYVVATIQLYVDIINIFVFILSIIGGGNKN